MCSVWPVSCPKRKEQQSDSYTCTFSSILLGISLMNYRGTAQGWFSAKSIVAYLP